MTWRDQLKVHPAADLFPLMSQDELRALGEDIKKNGLRTKIAVIVGDDGEPYLIDGRNRLDAMEMVGPAVNLFEVGERVCTRDPDGPAHDPYAYVISANIHRRHLTAEQRRDLIAKLLTATPEKSNRQIAETVKADDKTVGKVRRKLEATAEIPQLKKTTGKDGKARKKPRRSPDDFKRDIAAKKATPQPEPEPVVTAAPVTGDDIVASPEEIRKNILDSIERQVAIVRSFKRILRVSSLTQAMKDEVSDALGTLITNVQSLQRALRPSAPAEPEQHEGIPPFLRRTAP